MKLIKYTSLVVGFVMLTAITQIGGIALVIGLLLSRYWKFRYNAPVLILTSYLVLTFVAMPAIAPWFGREVVRHTDKIKPTTYLTVLLNRNYVKPDLNEMLERTARQLDEGIEIRYLDANFPFFDGFPLLPHLSHDDGKKIDISLMYMDEDGNYTHLKPSRSGYGCFEDPKINEFDQTSFCKKKGYWQYDFPKYLTLGSINQQIDFSPHYTKSLIDAILKNSNLNKLFIEKHLVDRMKLQDSRIRFQGCRAVRHDDHIHIQI